MIFDNMTDMDTILGKHFSGEKLSTEQENMLVKWVVTHKEEYNRLAKVWDTSNIKHTSEQNTAPNCFSEKFNSEAAWSLVYPRLKKNRSVKLASKFLAIAASVLLIVGVSLFWEYKSAGTPVVFANTSSKINTVLLPDSSSVMLYPNSQLKYLAKQSSTHTRNINLSGKAFFKVKRDVHNAFIVKSADVEIKVLGTSFLVSNSEESTQTDVFVREGHVQVSTGTKNLHLKTNEQASVYDDNIEKKEIVNPEMIFKDQIKHITYRNTPLDQVLKEIEKEFGIEIELESTLRSNRVSTQLHFVKLEDMLAELSYICNCKYKKISDKKYKFFLP